MGLSHEAVVAASNAWTWIPDNATVVETDEYLLVRFPDYFNRPLKLLRFTPPVATESAVGAAVGRAREFGLPALYWCVRPDSPPGVAELLSARGAAVDETLDVLARDLSDGGPRLPPSAVDVTMRWATDPETQRDGTAVDTGVFGGAMPPDDRLAENARQDGESVPAGKGGSLVAYVAGKPVGSGGVAVTGGVARLWGGAVVESARGKGVYRAILAARLLYGAANGASMALVKGRIETSGPILRRAGFTAHGQEVMYRVPL